MPQLIHHGTPAFSVYATKAAVRSFPARLDTRPKERQIRVNAISPGMVPTPGYDQFGFVKKAKNLESR